MINIYEQVDANKKKSFWIILFFTFFVFAVCFSLSYAFGYDYSLIGFALIFSCLLSLGSYYFSDRIILSISGAKLASPLTHSQYFSVVENLVSVAQIPMPKLYVISDTSMNAFATGRAPNSSVVCVTSGLLERLNRSQLEGVIAHELSHIKNYDIRLMSIVSVMVGVIALIADILLRNSWMGNHRSQDSRSGIGTVVFLVGLFLALLSPLVANLIQLAISRRREFLADASAALLTKYPEGLAQALEIIAQDREPLEVANKATAHLYISNPLKNHHDTIGWFSGLFNTHPPIESRIKALRS